MLISILEKLNNLNEAIFAPLDGLIEKLPFEDWIIDGITDSVHLLPFLFFIFVVIELLEFYFSDKIDSCIKRARKRSVAVGALASIFPQCGFSVIASSLYSRRMITRGCLIAVYLGTSDESIPILLAHPEKAYLIVPIVGLKLLIAIIGGYLIDILAGHFNNPDVINHEDSVDEAMEEAHEHVHEEGCCNHKPEGVNKIELILHPIQHTVNILSFILIITLILNYTLEHFPVTDFLANNSHRYLQCIAASVLGLIPNCAVSIALTMMLIKGHISFGVAMAGLLSNGGLGFIVLLKNNDMKDNIKIVAILLFISIFSGIIADVVYRLVVT